MDRMDAAIKHCEAGLGIWKWASNDTVDGGKSDPEVVKACAGDVPTLECIAAVELLRKELPGLRIRVVNVVDLMTLQPRSDHPHGLSDVEFDGIFTTDKPVIFAFHGYPALVNRLIYNRANHGNFHVHGFEDEGTTTTPFDMVVLNRQDRFHLMADVIDRALNLRDNAAYARQAIRSVSSITAATSTNKA
jgi:xylulose-5-phosphate/fructose-6-phosphate phosphoketolase